MIFSIQNITIVGAGTMGHSIGQEFALADYQVSIFDQSEEVIGKVKSRIQKNLEEMAEWGLLHPKQITPTLERIHTYRSLEDACLDADLVVEAVFEVLKTKQGVFEELDHICPPKTILASNTSSLMPSSLAQVTHRPEQVLVLHYFYPPHLMPLVEIVKSPQTSSDSAKAVYEAVIKVGKKPIITQKEALGFVANRLQSALLREAIFIIEQGICTPEDLDIAVKYGFGRRLAHVGPIELAEVQDGWLQMAQIEEYIFPDLNNNVRPSKLIEEKIKKNELGPRTGKGFYEWPMGEVEKFEKKLYENLANYIRNENKKDS